MRKEIDIVVVDSEGYIVYHRDSFDTIKEAKLWVKECLLERSFWDRLSENEQFAEQIDTIEIRVDGEVHSDWFPNFKN
jgi:hypothetical protein